MYHDRVVGLIYLFIPHPLEYLVGAEYLARVGSQQVQDIELNGCELDFLIVHNHFMVILVNGHSLYGYLVVGLFLGSAVWV